MPFLATVNNACKASGKLRTAVRMIDHCKTYGTTVAPFKDLHKSAFSENNFTELCDVSNQTMKSVVGKRCISSTNVLELANQRKWPGESGEKKKSRKGHWERIDHDCKKMQGAILSQAATAPLKHPRGPHEIKKCVGSSFAGGCHVQPQCYSFPTSTKEQIGCDVDKVTSFQENEVRIFSPSKALLQHSQPSENSLESSALVNSIFCIINEVIMIASFYITSCMSWQELSKENGVCNKVVPFLLNFKGNNEDENQNENRVLVRSSKRQGTSTLLASSAKLATTGFMKYSTTSHSSGLDQASGSQGSEETETRKNHPEPRNSSSVKGKDITTGEPAVLNLFEMLSIFGHIITPPLYSRSDDGGKPGQGSDKNPNQDHKGGKSGENPATSIDCSKYVNGKGTGEKEAIKRSASSEPIDCSKYKIEGTDDKKADAHKMPEIDCSKHQTDQSKNTEKADSGSKVEKIEKDGVKGRSQGPAMAGKPESKFEPIDCSKYIEKKDLKSAGIESDAGKKATEKSKEGQSVTGLCDGKKSGESTPEGRPEYKAPTAKASSKSTDPCKPGEDRKDIKPEIRSTADKSGESKTAESHEPSSKTIDCSKYKPGQSQSDKKPEVRSTTDKTGESNAAGSDKSSTKPIDCSKYKVGQDGGVKMTGNTSTAGKPDSKDQSSKLVDNSDYKPGSSKKEDHPPKADNLGEGRSAKMPEAQSPTSKPIDCSKYKVGQEESGKKTEHKPGDPGLRSGGDKSGGSVSPGVHKPEGRSTAGEHKLGKSQSDKKPEARSTDGKPQGRNTFDTQEHSSAPIDCSTYEVAGQDKRGKTSEKSPASRKAETFNASDHHKPKEQPAADKSDKLNGPEAHRPSSKSKVCADPKSDRDQRSKKMEGPSISNKHESGKPENQTSSHKDPRESDKKSKERSLAIGKPENSINSPASGGDKISPKMQSLKEDCGDMGASAVKASAVAAKKSEPPINAGAKTSEPGSPTNVTDKGKKDHMSTSGSSSPRDIIKDLCKNRERKSTDAASTHSTKSQDCRPVMCTKKKAAPPPPKSEPVKRIKVEEKPKLFNCCLKIVEPRKVEIENCPMPELPDDHVVVKMHSLGLCGSDVFMFVQGLQKTEKTDISLGHEGAGVVLDVGRNVENLKRGDGVVIEPGVPCGCCKFCKKGRYNLCDKVNFTGLLSTYVGHPAEFCHKVPRETDLELAALAHPLALALHACHRGAVSVGTRVLVLGACPRGLSTVIAARSMGADKIAIIDTQEKNLRVAAELCADITILANHSMSSGELAEKALSEMKCRPNVVIDCCGCTKTADLAVLASEQGGHCVLSGCQSETANLPILPALAKEICYDTSFRSANMFPKAVGLISTNRAAVCKMITHRMEFCEAQRAFDCASKEAESGAIKVMVKWPHSHDEGEARFKKSKSKAKKPRN
ncbi:uncharacterized protein LOC119648602 [Hermetia illucens]|uniref:uncharacterized protein LOC119648602 n=1 Tax=Hermetia illucens TaxID=343691 RepID=UPI0018CC4FAF|nr:uncharacterized protein LOC119648602 [Hermetia illucens]